MLLLGISTWLTRVSDFRRVALRLISALTFYRARVKRRWAFFRKYFWERRFRRVALKLNSALTLISARVKRFCCTCSTNSLQDHFGLISVIFQAAANEASRESKIIALSKTSHDGSFQCSAVCGFSGTITD